jgi:PAS domain-containing protein
MDPTELKRIQDNLSGCVEQFRAIFEQSPVGIVLTSLDGNFLQVNQQFYLYELSAFTNERMD